MYKIMVTTLWGEHVNVTILEFEVRHEARTALMSINAMTDNHKAGKSFSQTAIALY